ncbi:MAG TPA: STAS domain-containing protein [Kiritimatiellia bacterium]|nr:STAS domain-containing protein [Kiritimatiellia bacterium]HSA16743.1 STAS domain-containing protein [Kiritimatiellia bacterium]
MKKSDFKMFVEQGGSLSIMAVAGPVDSATLDQFRAALDGLTASPAPQVLLDCQNMAYISSRGLELLVKYHRVCSSQRGRFAVCGISPKLFHAMDLLGLGSLLNTFETRSQAIEAMR